MKKAFAFLTVAALSLGIANAQLGINAGYAPQTYTTTVSDNDPTTDNLDGFFVGVGYNQSIAKGINVSVGLQGRYNTASGSNSVNLGILGNSTANWESSQMLIDVPVLFNYGFDLNDGVRVSLFLGPVVSYALNGKTSWTADANVLSFLNLGTNGEDNWYEDGDNRNKMDLGGTAGVCVTFNQFRLFGGYNQGLLNLSTADNTTLKGSNWFIGLGYAL